MMFTRRGQRYNRSSLAPSLLLLLFTLWFVQSTYSIPNNGKLCKEQEELEECSYGSFVPDTKCPNQYCLKGPGARCDLAIVEMQCAPNLTCICGECMNCYNKDCRLLWCPNNLLEKLMKRFQRNLVESND